jgi:uncharacterized protein DUF5988
MSAPGHSPVPASTDPDKVEAVLAGGPRDLPAALRHRRASRTDTKIKILHRGGYEHFERAEDRPDGEQRPLVFTWTTRTKPAE